MTAIVCGLLVSMRYGLTEIFVGGFGSSHEGPLLDLIDGRFVMLTAGCAAIGVAFVEALSRSLVIHRNSRLEKRRALGALVGGGAEPKFGV